jgi:hypothetical protein
MDPYKMYTNKVGTKIEASCGTFFKEACGFLLLEDDRTTTGQHCFQGADSQQGRKVVQTFGHEFLSRDFGIVVSVSKCFYYRQMHYCCDF